MREGPAEAAPRLHRRADDDELGVIHGGDGGHVVAQPSRACPQDPAANARAVRRCDRGRSGEPLPQLSQLRSEVRAQRQLVRDDEGRDEDDAGSTVGGELACEVERVLRLLLLEHGNDDPAQPRQSHRRSW